MRTCARARDLSRERQVFRTIRHLSDPATALRWWLQGLPPLRVWVGLDSPLGWYGRLSTNAQQQIILRCRTAPRVRYRHPWIRLRRRGPAWLWYGVVVCAEPSDTWVRFDLTQAPAMCASLCAQVEAQRG